MFTLTEINISLQGKTEKRKLKNLLKKDKFVNAKAKPLLQKNNQCKKNFSKVHYMETKTLCFHQVYKPVIEVYLGLIQTNMVKLFKEIIND